MPNIKVVYWNVENFGDDNGRRGNYVPLCNFIAHVVRNVDADILCLMELRHSGIGLPLTQLQMSLLNAYWGNGFPTCDWYCDWVPGALVFDGFAGLPFNPNNVDFTNQARNEGYAVFWKQNIAKFIMQRADPIDQDAAIPPELQGGHGWVQNTQSGGVRGRVAAPININVLGGDITVPAGANYTVPAGTVGFAPGGYNQGQQIPAGTQIGNAGITLNPLINGVNPIVVPGGYVLTNNLTLPPHDTVLVPQHILSLVLTGRQIVNNNPVNYNPGPGGANNWQLLSFPSTAGALLWNGSRRPAYCTIRVNIPNAQVEDQIIPITIYHTPVAGLAPVRGMLYCALSRSLYEAYDHVADAYIHNTRAIVGGDFNARLDPNEDHYTIYTADFNNGGAGCNNAGIQNIRVNAPAPGAVPEFPPHGGGPLTNADNPLNKSTVQLRHPFVGAGAPVLSEDTYHYRRSSIDNIFYRGFNPGLLNQAPHHAFGDIYDLLQAVTGGPPPVGVLNFHILFQIIQLFQNVRIFNPQVGGGPMAPLEIPNVLSPLQLLIDIMAGNFAAPGLDAPALPGGAAYSGPQPIPANLTPARRAAEFIRLFLSDHLPVIFEMNL